MIVSKGLRLNALRVMTRLKDTRTLCLTLSPLKTLISWDSCANMSVINCINTVLQQYIYY